jgi:hypothetical protein
MHAYPTVFGQPGILTMSLAYWIGLVASSCAVSTHPPMLVPPTQTYCTSLREEFQHSDVVCSVISLGVRGRTGSTARTRRRG